MLQLEIGVDDDTNIDLNLEVSHYTVLVKPTYYRLIHYSQYAIFSSAAEQTVKDIIKLSLP